MCGIAGFVSFTSRTYNSTDVVRRMALALAHRGPDDMNLWVDDEGGVALGHRRLSILDLSPEGAQPMVSASGRFVVVYNGEVYNWRDLRAELGSLGDQAWRGHSDTEVVLAAIERWGIDGALRRLVGMFAFALWDRRDRALTIARDRVGEKPLYFGRYSSAFVFASELKGLRCHPSFVSEINRDALALLLRHNYIPAPHCIYLGANKLLPGTYLTISALDRDPVAKEYWTVRGVTEAGQRAPFTGTDADAVEHLDLLLRRSVREQMVADVPLGAFLSGGIDSSAVVALMQAQSATPVRTFTIGFTEDAYNEAHHAAAVARHLKTSHTELYVTPQQALEVIPRLPTIYDEPFSDSSQIPTFLVSQMARRDVTVSLSGDAGDELFAGYSRYVLTRQLWKKLAWLPMRLRRLVASLITAVPARNLNTLAALLPFRGAYSAHDSLLGDRLHKGAAVLGLDTADALYHALVSHWANPEALVIGAHEPLTVLTSASRQPFVHGNIERMMALDMLSYLPDDILTKVDRAAMAVSLETRVPFLDHRVIEFAAQLPISLKLRNGAGKWVLRQVLNRYVPRSLIERPKQGFGVPLDSWLRGPLRPWVEELISERRLRSDGYFAPAPILAKWREHLSGQKNWQYHLWDVLMFQAWLDTERGRARG
jgi:asparagine synthase (glutamine-hydrolysing)